MRRDRVHWYDVFIGKIFWKQSINIHKINVTKSKGKVGLQGRLHWLPLIWRLFIACSSKRKVSEYYKFAESITSVTLWIYPFISTYFAKTLGTRFLAPNVIKQYYRDERPRDLFRTHSTLQIHPSNSQFCFSHTNTTYDVVLVWESERRVWDSLCVQNTGS